MKRTIEVMSSIVAVVVVVACGGVSRQAPSDGDTWRMSGAAAKQIDGLLWLLGLRLLLRLAG